MTDPDLLKAITQGPLDNRRHCVQHLARHDLTERALLILGAAYVYSVSKADKPSSIYKGSMEIAVKMLGVVLEELVCTPHLNMKVSAFIDRVHAASEDEYSDTRMRIYTNTSLRLLAAYGVLKRSSRPRGRMQYAFGDLSKIFEVYEVDPSNWMNQRLLGPSSRAISENELSSTLASLSSREYYTITGEDLEQRAEEDEPAPPSAEDRISHLEKCILALVADNMRLKSQMERLEKLQLPGLCNYLTWPPPA